MSEYRGTYERHADHLIAEGAGEIEINWLNMSGKEAGRGGADKITKKLIAAGYRPDGSGISSKKVRDAYEAGEKLMGKYVRLPSETWTKQREEEAAEEPEQKTAQRETTRGEVSAPMSDTEVKIALELLRDMVQSKMTTKLKEEVWGKYARALDRAIEEFSEEACLRRAEGLCRELVWEARSV